MHCSLSIYRSDVCRIPQTNDVQLFEAAVKVIFPTIAIFALQVLVNVPEAYALARLRFRGRTTLFGAVLVCLLIPYQATALPIYLLFYLLGLLDTYAAMPPPKLVIAVGACAISGGPFSDNPEVHNGCGSLVPVDLFIPGCPPHPLTILDGLLRLLGRLES